MRVNKMEQYYEEAKELAAFYNQCDRVSTMPIVPVSNMFHVHFEAAKEKMETILTAISKETGIGLTGYVHEVTKETSNYEVSVGDLYSQVPKGALKNVFQLLNEKMKEN
jgi:hypothetical protein